MMWLRFVVLAALLAPTPAAARQANAGEALFDRVFARVAGARCGLLDEGLTEALEAAAAKARGALIWP